MAMALCVSCKKDNPEPSGGGTGGGNTGGGGGGTGSHEYVDLGLPSGTLWATCNVGAENPEEYGDHYAWGETETKDFYYESNYKWCNGSTFSLTKYNTKSDFGIVDNKTVLEMADDAASANWGDDWRMPTGEELYELYDKCTWTWTTQCGKNGYCVTGPNDKSIFLPAADHGTSFDSAGYYGGYWSSSLYSSYPGYACNIHFDSSDVYHLRGDSYRFFGLSVRPVRSVR